MIQLREGIIVTRQRKTYETIRSRGDRGGGGGILSFCPPYSSHTSPSSNYSPFLEI